jgi:hypothetical protein
MGDQFVAGVDVGNAMVKVYEGVRRRWMTPNAVDYRCDLKLVEGHGETPDSWLHLEVINSPVVVKPTRFYFGDLAVRRGASARPLVTAKLREEQTALAFLAALARTAAHRLSNMSKKEREGYLDAGTGRLVVPFVVGVGAPVHQYEDAEAKRLFASRVKGRHVVRFVDTPEYKDLGAFELNVDRAMLYQEGVSALADFRYDDAGAVRRRGELDCHVAVIDPGANTLDWATIKPDGAVDPTLTNGRDLGLAEAMDQLKDAINTEFERRYTRAQLISDLLELDYAIPQGNGSVPVWDQAKHYLQRVADDVLAVVRKLQNDSQNRIGLVLLVGGGAAALRRFLEPEFEKPAFKGVEVQWLNEPLYANAAGYFKRTMVKLAEEKAKVDSGHA